MSSVQEVQITHSEPVLQHVETGNLPEDDCDCESCRANQVCCETCCSWFIPAWGGQIFCSEECEVPLCSLCELEYGFLDGEQPNTRGMHLCAGCYWDEEAEYRRARAAARAPAPSLEQEENSEDDDHTNRRPEDYSSEDEDAEQPAEEQAPTKSAQVSQCDICKKNPVFSYAFNAHGAVHYCAPCHSTVEITNYLPYPDCERCGEEKGNNEAQFSEWEGKYLCYCCLFAVEPPCCVCDDEPATLFEHDKHLCADCYWDEEEKWRNTPEEEEVQYIFPGEPEYNGSHEEECSEEEITKEEEKEEQNYREMVKFNSFINKVRSHLKKKMPKNP